jgi:hypothetical protein
MVSTYMGKPYYHAWPDNLADDVTGEGGAWDGAIQGAVAVHEVVVAARAAPCCCCPGSCSKNSPVHRLPSTGKAHLKEPA